MHQPYVTTNVPNTLTTRANVSPHLLFTMDTFDADVYTYTISITYDMISQ